MTSVEVRRLSGEDVELARSVRLAALRESPGVFLATLDEALARPPEWWTRWLVNVAVYGAFLDGEPVGMAGALRTDDDPGVTELVSMWVAPDARRRGVAGRLIEAVAAYAREQGDKAVHLEIVAGNDAAEAAYLRAGFAHIPKRKSSQCDRSMWLDLD